MTTKVRLCRECGALLPAQKKGVPPSFYCCPEHRRQFNNRRMTRGAELYDFFMSSRFERKRFPHAITTMAQMASGWRDEDAGKVTWLDISKSDR